jgi:hypothetical protein
MNWQGRVELMAVIMKTENEGGKNPEKLPHFNSVQ